MSNIILPWNRDININSPVLNIPGMLSNGGFFIGELYRDTVNNRFGGNHRGAYENNNWLPCGEPVNLVLNNVPVNSVTVLYTEGDTYIQRYDCLKTYSDDLT
jgi:hypothetical protein